MNIFIDRLTSVLEQLFPLTSQLYTFLLSFFCAGAVLLVALFFLLLQNRKQGQLLVASKKKNRAVEFERKKLEIQATRLLTLLKNERKHSVEKLQLLEDAKEKLRLQFESLAQKIFDEKSSQFTVLNQQNLKSLLDPFSNHLAMLKKELNEITRNDTKERASLKNEIVQLQKLNEQVNQEASNLTRALTADVKAQGNWGELVLEKVLEISGLRKGIEYESQTGFRDPDNKLQKPDVIVHLPEGRDIIIDAKVSLTNWEKYVNSHDSREKENHLKAHSTSLKNHLASLEKKNYATIPSINSLDFILMFLPIEAAFAAAMDYDETLLSKGIKKNIILVTPTTLLATMRVIKNIWQFEQQSSNAAEIARRAGSMHDKFCLFLQDLEKLGKQLGTCSTTYDDTLRKLKSGRGNLISQAKQLQDLGVQTQKKLPVSDDNEYQEDSTTTV